jgi:orotidine-5'-phosphate decarboxylase
MNDKLPLGPNRIILALDVDTVEKAHELMTAVSLQVSYVKIGLELINAQLAGKVAEIANGLGFRVFWDGKLKDIPTTVAKAVKVATKSGAFFIDVHADCAVEAMMAAVNQRGSSLILAVTELTSLETEDVELEAGASRKAKVLYLARMAAYSGCDGIVCSTNELMFLAKYSARKVCPEKQLAQLLKVVPGTRSPGADANDQKNIDTPANAILNGADLLVIGREITANPKESPFDAAVRINKDIATALLKLQAEGK